MSTRLHPSKQRRDSYVSTGHLPPAEQVKALGVEAHQRFKSNQAGKNSQVYPALPKVPPDRFGICVVGTNGNVHATGRALNGVEKVDRTSFSF